ncbi:MAG: methylmalonyl Co-A mutase-associated GTPase MeaB [Desulfobacterales bacterium]|jgi:LAO/AO transport system kinase
MKADPKKVLQGNQLAGGRLIRLLEEGASEGIACLKAIFPHTGNAFVLGITGPAGSGKSTLVAHIIAEFRRRDLKVGVVAVDPSSPLSGGAFLGDRLRMRQHTEDEGVFIRSMATRGHLGGLSRTTRETVMVLDAMGYDVVIIETVGVGQDEVEIADFAHTTAIVSIPGLGDDIQTMKAGLLEVGDVFIVNKADRPGADDEVTRLESMLEMGTVPEDGWKPPVLQTVAVKGEGIAKLVDVFLRHRQFQMESGQFKAHNSEQTLRLVRSLVMEMAADKIFKNAEDSDAYQTLLGNLDKRKIDPFTAAEKLVKGL